MIFDIKPPPADGHPVRQAHHHIFYDGPLTTAEIARRVGYSPPTVLAWLRDLERQGFVVGEQQERRYRGGRPQTIWRASTSLSVLLRDMVVPKVRRRRKAGGSGLCETEAPTT